MAHTILCGQRRYTMPAIVIPNRSDVIDKSNANFTWVGLKLTNIRPPSGIVIAGALALDKGITPRIRFTTEKEQVIIVAPTFPTLFLSDGTIQSVEYGYDTDLDFFEYWIVPDVSYLVEVREAYGNG